MSLSTCAALVRNLGCVAKTVLPQTNFLQKVVPLGPLKNVRLVESFVAPAQAMGVAFNVYNGYTDVVKGLNDFKQLDSQLTEINSLTPFSDMEGSAEFVLKQGISANRKAALTKMLIGLCKFVIGSGFIFLVLNTLHLNPPHHPTPLFSAIIFIEVSLLSILVVMLRGIFGAFAKSKKLFNLATIFDSSAGGNMNTRQRVNTALNAGFGTDFFGALQAVDESFVPTFKTENAGKFAVNNDLRVLKDLMRIDSTVVDSTQKLAQKLFKQAYTLFVDTVFDSVYFALNAIAFYGYMMGVLAFFVPGAENPTSAFQKFVHQILFKLPNGRAMDLGILAGDAAWTVEPIISILNPYIVKYVMQRYESRQQQQQRVQIDGMKKEL